jgi:hypothetical protein
MLPITALGQAKTNDNRPGPCEQPTDFNARPNFASYHLQIANVKLIALAIAEIELYQIRTELAERISKLDTATASNKWDND